MRSARYASRCRTDHARPDQYRHRRPRRLCLQYSIFPAPSDEQRPPRIWIGPKIVASGGGCCRASPSPALGGQKEWPPWFFFRFCLDSAVSWVWASLLRGSHIKRAACRGPPFAPRARMGFVTRRTRLVTGVQRTSLAVPQLDRFPFRHGSLSRCAVLVRRPEKCKFDRPCRACSQGIGSCVFVCVCVCEMSISLIPAEQ